jgi:hypothetical protein
VVSFDDVFYEFTKMSSSNGGGELVGGEDGFIVIGVGFAVVGTILGINIVATASGKKYLQYSRCRSVSHELDKSCKDNGMYADMCKMVQRQRDCHQFGKAVQFQ